MMKVFFGLLINMTDVINNNFTFNVIYINQEK